MALQAQISELCTPFGLCLNLELFLTKSSAFQVPISELTTKSKTVEFSQQSSLSKQLSLLEELEEFSLVIFSVSTSTRQLQIYNLQMQLINIRIPTIFHYITWIAKGVIRKTPKFSEFNNK